MKKFICTTSILLLLLLGLTACSELTDAPTSDEVLRDVELSLSNILIGKAKDIEENFPLTTLIIEEMDIEWVKGDKTLDAEITAFFGDKKWKSEIKQAITVQYVLNTSKQWEARGANMNNPVIRVIPRE